MLDMAAAHSLLSADAIRCAAAASDGPGGGTGGGSAVLRPARPDAGLSAVPSRYLRSRAAACTICDMLGPILRAAVGGGRVGGSVPSSAGSTCLLKLFLAVLYSVNSGALDDRSCAGEGGYLAIVSAVD